MVRADMESATPMHQSLRMAGKPPEELSASDYLVDHELDLSSLDAKFKNDEMGASAYDPRVMLKIVLLAYSQGLISRRTIEQAFLRNVQFIAISGDSQPNHAHIAKFVCSLSE